VSVVLAQQCEDVGDQTVECDPDCAPAGGLGCGAGGEAIECRFCGFGGFRPCKGNGHCCGYCCDEFCQTSTESSTSKTTTQSTTRSTQSTTRTTKPSGGGDNNGGNNNNNGGGIGNNDNPACNFVTAEPGELIFEENWDDLNMDVWEHEITMGGGGNWEFQTYFNNRSNSYVRDNTLYIMPTTLADEKGEDFLWTGTQDLWGAQPSDQCTGNAWWGCSRSGNGANYLNPINSARLRTVKSLNVRFARLEINAKLPRGDWLWPAIWMLPKHLPYGKWPASGEIDIMESRGNDDITDPGTGGGLGNKCFGSTLHWGPFWPANGYPKTTKEYCLPNGRSFADEWHTYTVDWTSEYIAFELDGEEFMRVSPKDQGGFWEWGEFESDMPGINNPWKTGTDMAPFDTQFHLIMNLAVGGATDYWSDNFNYAHPKPWRTTSEIAMKEFWDARNQWMPTWKGEDAGLKIGQIRIWQRGDGTEQLQQDFKSDIKPFLNKKSTKMHPMFKN